MNGDCLGRQQLVAINHEDTVVFEGRNKISFMFALEDPSLVPKKRQHRMNRQPFAVLNTVRSAVGVRGMVQEHELSCAKIALKAANDTVSRMDREKKSLENRLAIAQADSQV